jgi:hypothetical protein
MQLFDQRTIVVLLLLGLLVVEFLQLIKSYREKNISEFVDEEIDHSLVEHFEDESIPIVDGTSKEFNTDKFPEGTNLVEQVLLSNLNDQKNTFASIDIDSEDKKEPLYLNPASNQDVHLALNDVYSILTDIEDRDRIADFETKSVLLDYIIEKYSEIAELEGAKRYGRVGDYYNFKFHQITPTKFYPSISEFKVVKVLRSGIMVGKRVVLKAKIEVENE